MMKKLLALIVTLLIVSTTALAYDELAKGSKGEAVAALQQVLINQCYLSGNADGDYGKKTAAAVSAFQKANGIGETGIADDKTQTAAFNREEERLSSLVLSRDSTGYDVKQLQNKLIDLGYLSSKANGSFDMMTEAALVVFQAHNGLTPTGIADKSVRDILYSDTALSANDKAKVADSLEANIEINQPEAGVDARQDATKNEYPLLVAPTDDYIIERLGLVDSIAVIAAATEENDPNGKLNKPGGYTAQIYFSSTLVNKSADRRTTAQVISDGTDGGGSIEIYSTEKDAEKREEYLAALDGTIISSGSHKIIGTCIVRTSDDLSASEQSAFEAEIVKALTTENVINTSSTTEPAEPITQDASGSTEEDEQELLLSIPIGSNYAVGSDIIAGSYLCRTAGDLASMQIKGSDGSWDNLSLWGSGDAFRLTLIEGDTFDVEYATIDFYTCSEFKFDNPDDIVIMAGNRYLVGKDIPSGNYSGYTEGQQGASLCIYESMGGNISDVFNLDKGDQLGKTMFSEGNAFTVQSGILHLVPYKGFGSSVGSNAAAEVVASPESGATGSSEPRFLFSIPIGSGYTVAGDVNAGLYLCRSASDLASMQVKGPQGSWDYLSLWGNEDAFRLSLVDGDTFDVEYAAIDFYECPGFEYDNPDDIAIMAGNRYLVGRDIPAGSYSAYTEGKQGASICIYKTMDGSILDVFNLDGGEELGKTTLNEGNAFTVQSGVIHLVPFKGFGNNSKTPS